MVGDRQGNKGIALAQKITEVLGSKLGNSTA